MEYFEHLDIKKEEEIWGRYGRTMEMAKQDIESLQNWLHSQPHLPHHVLKYQQLKNFFIMNKCQLEKCKPKIEMYFRIKSVFPDVFTNRYPLSPRMLEVSKYIHHISLPKLCPNLSRITIMKPKKGNENLDMYSLCSYVFNTVDLRLLEDFADGNILIFDAEHCKMSYIAKLSPTYIKMEHYIYEKVITSRLLGIHIINAPSFVEQILSLVKTIIKPKLMDRIKIHQNLDSLLEIIPRDILPREYGGNEKSLQELDEMFLKRYEENKDFFKLRDECQVNEELRPSINDNDDFFGYYGTFKQLEVD